MPAPPIRVAAEAPAAEVAAGMAAVRTEHGVPEVDVVVRGADPAARRVDLEVV